MGMIGIFKALPEQAITRMAAGNLDAGELLSISGDELDIDKAWEGIHYVLTGDIMGGAPPLGSVVPMLEDQGMDLQDFGAFYLYPDQVKAALEAVKDYTKADFAAYFAQNNPMEEQVYPLISDDNPEEFLDYLYQYFSEIQAYYKSVAEAGKGVAFYIV